MQNTSNYHAPRSPYHLIRPTPQDVQLYNHIVMTFPSLNPQTGNKILDDYCHASFECILEHYIEYIVHGDFYDLVERFYTDCPWFLETETNMYLQAEYEILCNELWQDENEQTPDDYIYKLLDIFDNQRLLLSQCFYSGFYNIVAMYAVPINAQVNALKMHGYMVSEFTSTEREHFGQTVRLFFKERNNVSAA